jgi:rRNA processing protein Gar1
MVYKMVETDKVPKFNHPVYTHEKVEVGKVDEIFGSTTEPVRTAIPCMMMTLQSSSNEASFISFRSLSGSLQYFTVKPNQGFVATSFKVGDPICMGPFSLLNKQMFTEEDKPKAPRYRTLSPPSPPLSSSCVSSTCACAHTLSFSILSPPTTTRAMINK